MPVDLSKQAKNPPSSTRLREIIATTADGDLERALGEVALSPALLAKLVRQYKPMMASNKSWKPENLGSDPRIDWSKVQW